MKQYTIKLTLTEANIKVLLDSLNQYKGSAQLVASCITACIKAQISIKKKESNEE